MVVDLYSATLTMEHHDIMQQGESVLRPAVLHLLKELGMTAALDPCNQGSATCQLSSNSKALVDSCPDLVRPS